MPTQELHHAPDDDVISPLDANWQYVSAELDRLDLLLRLEMERVNRNVNDPLRSLKGLVITADEIAPLLAPATVETAPADADGLERERLLAAIDAASAAIDERIRHDMAAGDYLLAFPRFADQFGLSAIERRCLLVCLAPEVGRKYETLYAFLQDDVTRKSPTVDLALRLACGTPAEQIAARAIFDADAPLRKYRLIEVAESSGDRQLPLLTRPLKLDDRIAELFLGRRVLDAAVVPVAQLIDPTYEAGIAGSTACVEQMHGFVERYFGATPLESRNALFHVRGTRDRGQLALAALAASHLQLPLLRCDAREIAIDHASAQEILWRLAREAALQPAVLAIENFDALIGESGDDARRVNTLLEAVSTLSRLTFLFGGQAWRPPLRFRERLTLIQYDMPEPGYGDRIAAWRQHLQDEPGGDDIDAAGLASRFRFTTGQMRESLSNVRDQLHWRANGETRLDQRDIYRACRAQANPALESLARRIEPVYSWRDFVLPDDQIEQLRELCNQARYRHVVLGEWGFDRKLSHGKGIATLFSGPPGTGKTMAAEVVAGELDLDLYKIDLSRVVSKYIGESEKNLDRVFAAADDSNAILFFDEADALFGKRSEVRDSHDRYANLEISYLLQKMEEYEGVSILATNLRSHLDDAFLRRLQGIIEFPFPDADQRERIWRVMFPDEAPLAADVDLSRLAEEMRLTGANIKNISLAAAYLAADNGGTIKMSHLYRAARREHEKIGCSFNRELLADAGGVSR